MMIVDELEGFFNFISVFGYNLFCAVERFGDEIVGLDIVYYKFQMVFSDFFWVKWIVFRDTCHAIFHFMNSA
jgi:hypothetical protein